MTPSLEHEIRDLRSRFWSERDPEGRGFVPLADALRRNGALDEALELLDEGLARHPSFSSAHLVRGWVYRDVGDLTEAEEALRRVLALDPENARALHGLGQLLARVGRVAVGRELVVRGLELDPLLEWEEGGALAAPVAPGTPTAPMAETLSDGVVDIRSLAPRSPDGILGDPDGQGPLVEIAYLAPPGAAGPQAASPVEAGVTGEAVPGGHEGAGDLDDVPDPWSAPIVDIASLAPEPPSQPVVEVGSLAPAPTEMPQTDAPPEPASIHEDRSEAEPEAEVGPEPGSEADPVELEAEPVELRAEPAELEAEPVEREAEPVDLEAGPVEHEAELVELEAEPVEREAEPVEDEAGPVEREAEPEVGREAAAAAAPPELEDDDEVLLTRTMIELMERQGLHAQALDVARRLLARDPDDAILARRVAELEAGGAQASAAPTLDEAPAHEVGPPGDAADGEHAAREDEPTQAPTPTPDPEAVIADYLRDVLSWPDPSGGGEGR